MEQGSEMVRVVVRLIAGFLSPSRGCRSNLYLSNIDTVLYLRVRNISHAPIQNIWCTGRLLLDCCCLGHIVGQGYLALIVTVIRMYVARHQRELGMVRSIEVAALWSN